MQPEPAPSSLALAPTAKPSKALILRQKRESKLKQQKQQNRCRKNSMQLSLFGWLVKNRPKQDSSMTQLPQNIIVLVYSYLRISEIVSVSHCCYYLHECARSIWNDADFFKELQTDKLSYVELRKLFEMGGKMGHIQQLRNIYMGKNLKACREKIKVKVKEGNNRCVKPVAGNLLQIFQISTKVHKSSAFLMDNHLQEILNSSFRSLLTIKLQCCRYIRKFADISKCCQLTTLWITQNSYLSNEDLKQICSKCVSLQNVDFSSCDGLDQGTFKHLCKLINLKILKINQYNQPFGELQCLKSLTNLKQVSIQNSCIMDGECISLIRQLQSLQYLNIRGCQLLTDFFITNVIYVSKYHKVHLQMFKNRFTDAAIQEWIQFSQNGQIV